MNIIRNVLAVLLIAVAGISLSSCGYEAKGEKIEQAIHENVNPIPGVTSVDPHINTNTSGTFITLGIVADSYDEDELKSIAKEALTRILKDPRIEDGSLGMGVFSPDKSINIGPSDIGCTSTGSLDSLRKCFA